MDHWQYLIVLGACLLITAPLEFLGAGVYRQPVRLLLSVGPVAAVFVMWDAIAIAGQVWSYNPRYISGVDVGFSIPLEELLFFIVIPICGLLTYSAVSTILGALRGRR
ncbi:lycopene cyclase domain-containing protein [Mycolicibacterium sarraceniae]|uniref:Lycopene cyclase n=1 Tax=Mycolicibacterium sarraceniae TaxID=1534348 RepID=A0A7I7SU91_9MYCO|nr:lycopene cyclase domain-containing protein [Mycolicibacterium sarraceniae]BBY60358.1 lycopene cyclase [Mycolicibacterium sarraceniae]